MNRKAQRPLTERDRRFLERHRQLAKEDQRPARGSAAAVEIAGEMRRETEAAVLWFDGVKEVWLPKSQMSSSDDENVVLIPEWLAKEKGLI